MYGFKSISAPLDRICKPSAYKGEEIKDAGMYKKMVKILIYLIKANIILSFVGGLVRQFIQQPIKPHLDCIRRIVRYVKLHWIIL